MVGIRSERISIGSEVVGIRSEVVLIGSERIRIRSEVVGTRPKKIIWKYSPEKEEVTKP